MGLRRARNAIVWLLIGELVALAASGTWLFFRYRPTASQAWDDIVTLQPEVRTMVSVRRFHHQVGSLTVATALAVAVILLVCAAFERPRWRRIVVPVVLFQGVLLASFTGYLLPWDQLALWRITVGTNMAGYTPLFGDDVRFVLLGGKEIGVATLLRWLAVHVVLGALLLVLAAIALRKPRRSAQRHARSAT